MHTYFELNFMNTNMNMKMKLQRIDIREKAIDDRHHKQQQKHFQQANIMRIVTLKSLKKLR